MITIGYSTRKINFEFKKYLESTFKGIKGVQVIEKINDGEFSLSEVYNCIINESENEIVVLCHDDIYFDSNGWVNKIVKHFEKNPEYGILGVAGSTSIPKSGMWWEDRSKMVGIVNHEHEGKKWESKYCNSLGNNIKDTIIVDGLFIALHKSRIKHNFDEGVEGFHFYDVDFGFRNYLDGVKIGVVFNIRITHKSIGMTNEKWEQNRELFAEKFKEHLPTKLEEDTDSLTTYVICHDQDIIKANIQSGKYNNLGQLVFMYVGKGEFSDLDKYPNVIIVRDLKHNIEQYPKFTAFTAWYAIWRHNLCKTKYINLLEYDTNPKDGYSFFLKNFLKHSPKVINYFPFSMRNYHFIDNPDWVSTLFKAIKSHYKIDIEPFIRNIITQSLAQKREPVWGTTNNVCFEYATFEKYMKWVAPLINYLKDDVNCGHAQERAVTFYCLLYSIPVAFFQGYIDHVQADSHKTQGHTVTKEVVL